MNNIRKRSNIRKVQFEIYLANEFPAVHIVDSLIIHLIVIICDTEKNNY